MENKVDENSGRYDFGGDPFKPITVKNHGIPIPDTPGARSIAEGNKLRSEIFSILASQAASEIDAVIMGQTKQIMDIDIEKITKQFRESGMKHEDVLGQLIGWHTLALAKGTSEEKIGAVQFFTSLEYLTGPHKIKVL